MRTNIARLKNNPAGVSKDIVQLDRIPIYAIGVSLPRKGEAERVPNAAPAHAPVL